MKRNKGFTLIEILIVLAIIGILAALLFPVFKRVRENAHQVSCTANLHQIGLAVALYRNDEKEYPASLAFLLPNDSTLVQEAPTTTINGVVDSCDSKTCKNLDGTGYLKSTKNLMCPDDDKDDVVRSSYGNISTTLTTVPGTYADPSDMSRYLWNFYGYDANGVAYSTAEPAAAATPAILANSNNPSYDINKNPLKYSLSNRFAPPDTIVTHCIFHRTQTSNVDNATLVGPNAHDIVLRLDGAAKSVDVSEFTGNGRWQSQNK